MLEIEQISTKEWFGTFLALDQPLTKVLLLVAICSDQNLVSAKETNLFKRYVLQISESRITELVQAFQRNENLYAFRNQLRGSLGIPRQQESDKRRA